MSWGSAEEGGEVLCRLFRLGRPVPEGFWSRLLCRLLSRLDMLDSSSSHHDSPTLRLPPTAKDINARKSLLTRERSGVGKSDELLTLYWARGLIRVSEMGVLRVESLWESQLSPPLDQSGPADEGDGVVVTWISSPPFDKVKGRLGPYFGMAVDEVNWLLSELFPEGLVGEEGVERLAVCPGCYGGVGERCLFPVEALARLSLQGDATQCPLHPEPVPLSALIPDLLLLHLPRLIHFSPGSIHDLQSLKQGGQGEVFKGTFGQTEVALKAFHNPSGKLGGGGSETMETVLLRSTSLRPRTCRTLMGKYFQRSSDEYGTTTREQECIMEEEIKVLIAFLRLRREVLFLLSLTHPFIVGILGVTMGRELPLGFVLELAKEGDLLSLVHRRRRHLISREEGLRGCVLDRFLTLKIAWQMAVALEYLHEKMILYRDLKAENVLVWSKDPNHPINIKLSDYGISCFSSPDGMVGAEGTRGYQAPEVILNMKYGEKADMFSYGMTLFELLSGTRPFTDHPSDTNRAVIEGKRPAFPSGSGVDMVELVRVMEECWFWNPRDRPSASQVRGRLATPSAFFLRAALPLKERDASIVESANEDGFAIVTRASEDGVEVADHAPLPLPRLLIPMPECERLWVSGGVEEDRRASFADLRTCEWAEEEMHWPAPLASTCTLAASTPPFLFLLCPVLDCPTSTTVEVYKVGKGHPIPSQVYDFPLHLQSEATSFAASQKGEEEVMLWMGSEDGSVTGLVLARALDNLRRVEGWEEGWSSGAPVKHIVLAQDGTLCWTSRNSLHTARVTNDTFMDHREIQLSSSIAYVDHLVITSAGVIWCGSRSEGVLVRVELGRAGTESEEREVGLGEERGVDGVLWSGEVLWVAVPSGQLLLLDPDSGRVLTSCALPAHQSFSIGTVERLVVVGGSVCALVEYREPRKGEGRGSIFASPSLKYTRRFSLGLAPNSTQAPTVYRHILVFANPSTSLIQASQTAWSL